MRFKCAVQVLIDESTQAAEPECLIPMVLGAKQVRVVLSLAPHGPPSCEQRIS